MSQTLAAGSRLGRYRLLRRIATGGMAEVWLARSTGYRGFAKEVALKTILPQFAGDPDFLQLFVNEALLAAELDHPNIVQIYDLGELSGIYYIAMELLAGRTLRQIKRIHRRRGIPLPAWFVVHVVAAVCDGLEFAHSRIDSDGAPSGLVHRDVTPENIMVTYTGQPKVLDFGIAQATTAVAPPGTGLIGGKYAYLAPEQLLQEPASRALDGRVDVFALGVVLYEMLVGTRPFRGDSGMAVLRSILDDEPPPPLTLLPTLDPRLSDIILRALAKDPGQRYGSALELRSDLEAFLVDAGDEHLERDMGAYVCELCDEQRDPACQAARALGSGPDSRRSQPPLSSRGPASERAGRPSSRRPSVPPGPPRSKLRSVPPARELSSTGPTAAPPVPRTAPAAAIGWRIPEWPRRDSGGDPEP